ncbi:BRO family protein [Paracoccus sp. SCSIO 75233]|uniref:BRO-N domain-containing protein n=1 Tax=Paracoccus sp. SCSIO 75233 TaxID=3017782 RepID=UPI0022F08C61|nr:BRO family protein [Paracoccus sp. SCSIO 75233]WBU54630.1 BRO family protein [Paracoccus sp. SCSIO 75233]
MSTPHEITAFTYLDKHSIRTVSIDGEPWLVARDVLDVLGIGNMSMALSNVNKTDVTETRLRPKHGRANKLVNEAGFYKLVLRSNKPEAKPFQPRQRRSRLGRGYGPAVHPQDGLLRPRRRGSCCGNPSGLPHPQNFCGRCHYDRQRLIASVRNGSSTPA